MPGVSVSIGILLAVTNLGVLIYFIHHVAISIQATSVIQVVSEELRGTIDRLWPEELGSESIQEAPPQEIQFLLDEATTVHARSSGYVDAIQDASIIKIAKDHNLIIKLEYRPGHFAVQQTPLAWAWPAQRVDEKVARQLAHSFLLAPQRTPFQDVEFAIDQLVEVAVRALSPGVNDPFTAINCIDRLGEALCQMARRSIPSSLRYDDEGQLRVITYPAGFRAVTNAAFNQIRQYGCGSAAVMICLLETISVIVSFARRAEDRAALAHHAELVTRAGRNNLNDEADIADLEERYRLVQEQLSKPALSGMFSK